MERINNQIDCLITIKERLKESLKDNKPEEFEGIERALYEISKYESELCIRGLQSLKRYL